MKKYMTYAVTAFFATIAISIAAPDKDAMIAKEKAAWQAFKDKKTDEFKKLLSSNFAGVYSDGIYTLQKQVDSMQKWDLKSFSLNDPNVTMTDADTAIVICKATIDGTYEGKDVSGNYNSGTIWQKAKNGEWHAIFHTDMKEEAPGAAQPTSSP
jgi:hypothetical protein